MTYSNNATRTRRELLIQLCRLLKYDLLEQEIDRIPITMRPKQKASIRCCTHKDRAVLKYKLMALLGFNIDDEADELTSLKEYVQLAQKRQNLTSKVLTVVDEACSSCQQGSYHISNFCQGCEARPCAENCPRGAISFEKGQAIIDHSLCINCGKCLKECPFHAIIYRPVPCEEACPVKAISKDEKGIERIDYDKCILCGKCMASCPFGAIMEKSHIIEICKAWKSNKRVVALVAPSIAAQFSQSIPQIYKSIKEVGFNEIVEVAEGAVCTAEHESKEWLDRMNSDESIMTTSCCHAYTELVKKHIPDLEKIVSETPTPMCYAGDIARKRFPDAINVFIGPCTAKRHEAYFLENIDYVLSFEELGALLVANEIDINTMKSDIEFYYAEYNAQNFAQLGGVTNAIKEKVNPELLKPHIINGINKASIRELKQLTKKKSEFNFIEVMSCENGCVGGVNTLIKGKQALNTFKSNLDTISN